MSNFFDSEIVQREMKDIHELQTIVYNASHDYASLNREDKIEHIENLTELLDMQRVMYTRLSLSDDPNAKKMKAELEKSVILYVSETIPKADLTIKAIGNQWYWSYEYPDYGDIVFDANMLNDDELSDPKLRLLETDTQIVVPVNKVVKLQITSNDVLHAWTIPAFGVKMDAVPGKLNETWFKANQEGLFYGQCSELCGPKHAFMPINVKVVSEKEFEDWIGFAKEEYASSNIDLYNNTFEIAQK